MDLYSNIGIKVSNEVDEREVNKCSTNLMMPETAENVDVKRHEKRTKRKKSSNEQPKDKKQKKFSVSEAVMLSIETLKEPEGTTVEDILDFIQSYYNVNKHLMKRHVIRFLQTAVQNGVLEYVSGFERFKVKKAAVAKKEGKETKSKTPKTKKLFNADEYHLKKTDVEKNEQRMKVKLPDVIGEDEQLPKIKKTKVEKEELQFNAKQAVVKKDKVKLKVKEAIKRKKNSIELQKSDNIKKGKRQSKIKRADSKQVKRVDRKDTRKVKRAYGVKKKEAIKKPKKKNAKK